MGVSKTFPAQRVIEAIEAGLSDVGENWIQEAVPKIAEVAAAGFHPVWHLVGHLQTNKVKQALASFATIDSVDSLHLAEAISRRADRVVPVLVEVNLGGEVSKYGLPPDDVVAVVGRMARLPNIDVQGLMTVAPIVPDPEDLRPLFRTLRGLRDTLGLRHLSMGMTDDFEVAIEEGSTMVRLGRAIFGERAAAATASSSLARPTD